MVRRPPRSTLFPSRRSSDLLGFPVRRQVGLSVLARRAQALDVPVHGAKVGLRRLLHAPPRHGGARLERLDIHDPSIFGHRRHGQPKIGGVRRPPGTAPSERPAPEEPVLFRNVALPGRVAGGMTVVAVAGENHVAAALDLSRAGPLRLRTHGCENQRYRPPESAAVSHRSPPSCRLKRRRGSSASAALPWRASRRRLRAPRPPRLRRAPASPCRRAPSRAPTGTASRCPGGRSSP